MADNCYEYVDENLRAIRENIAETADRCGRNADSVRLMAVTKTVAPEIVNHAVSLGLNLLGENRVQEFLSKQEAYDKSAQIHFIGHLQTNKVKYIIDPVTMIQSVDSLKLAQEINRLAVAHNKTMDVLCEVNIGGEDSKSGVSPDNLRLLLEQISVMEGIRVKGLMTIPPPSDSDVFLGKMEELFNNIKSAGIPNISMDELSMGMTHDYQDAIIHGATIVRIGTGLFGKRNYNI
ncbi:MAG: YggS family pyridoxal phosphate-dependent enzyme [Ruminococcus flavefaciens]|nr:YggS family pyridoxal phosphate-dependent enzyme [Ruminococcus flavefaciens]MCM1229506.1 YggS family pyridoxal phosphate-dependent enzyme [Ruminococcus flavefaciens]